MATTQCCYSPKKKMDLLFVWFLANNRFPVWDGNMLKKQMLAMTKKTRRHVTCSHVASRVAIVGNRQRFGESGKTKQIKLGCWESQFRWIVFTSVSTMMATWLGQLSRKRLKYLKFTICGVRIFISHNKWHCIYIYEWTPLWCKFKAKREYE